MSRKTALVDFDTPIYSAACIIQESPLVVEHKLSKRKKEFKNKTEWKEFLASDKGKGYSDDDFIIVQEPRLKAEISHALHIIKGIVEKLQHLEFVSDVQLFVGGQGNYRKEVYPAYKGTRPPKPLAFQQCYDYVLSKYKDIVTVCDGEEAEDRVSILAEASYQKAKRLRDKEAMDCIVFGVDKDLNQVSGWRYNYNKPELGVWWVSDVEGWRSFCLQCFKGDATDDIPGLKLLPEKVKTKYGITTRGVGDATSEKLLEGTNTIKEMTQRVVDVWRESYPDDWQKQLNMNAILLRLRKYDGEMFDFVEHAKKMGVDV